MPQEIRVVCCCKCNMFQVDIVKKVKKCQCKLCQEKQGLVREYFRGSGTACRRKVQQLNANANSEQIEVENKFLSVLNREDLHTNYEENVNDTNTGSQVKIENSKWQKYVDMELNPGPIDFSKPSKKMQRKSLPLSDTSPGSSEFNYFESPKSTVTTPSTSKWDKYL